MDWGSRDLTFRALGSKVLFPSATALETAHLTIYPWGDLLAYTL